MTLKSVFVCDSCKEDFLKAFPGAKKQSPGTGLCSRCPDSTIMVDGTFFLVSIVKSGPRK